MRPVMENLVCMIGMFMSYSIFENMTVGLRDFDPCLIKERKEVIS